VGLALPAASVEPVCTYLELVKVWGLRTNLTAAGDEAARVRVLVEPAVEAMEWVEGPDLVDVGSGNGSPGLVLALLRPELSVTLLEPRLKRWAFLRDAVRRLGRGDVHVVRARHDGHGGPPAQSVTVRALRLRPGELRHLVRPGGRVLILGRSPAPEPDFQREEGLKSPRLHVFRRSGEGPRST
jgi:16S rRNA (guanine527-N7)-methyltransferase